MKIGLFSSSYWGPIDYYAALIQYDKVFIEQWESFPKQSFRNRCYIDSPNGKLMLNFPVDHGSKSLIKDTRLAPDQSWSQKHWQAIKSSYGNAPFFDALAPELEAFYQKEWSGILNLNQASMDLVRKWLRSDFKLEYSSSWEENPAPIQDRREDFHPKQKDKAKLPPYPQVFDHKHGFLDNLSILDLIFNEGPAAYDYLEQV